MNTKKGFTLVELLVVIAILAILATVSVVGYTSFIERAEQSNAQTELHQIETSVNAYVMANDVYEIGAAEDGTKYYVTKTADGVAVCIYNTTDKKYEAVDTIAIKTWNTDIAELLSGKTGYTLTFTNVAAVTTAGSEAPAYVTIKLQYSTDTNDVVTATIGK